MAARGMLLILKLNRLAIFLSTQSQIQQKYSIMVYLFSFRVISVAMIHIAMNTIQLWLWNMQSTIWRKRSQLLDF